MTSPTNQMLGQPLVTDDDGMLKAAYEMDVKVAEFRGYVQGVDQEIQELQRSWISDATPIYVGAMNDWAQKARHIIQLLETLSANLKGNRQGYLQSQEDQVMEARSLQSALPGF